ncbi:MAG TPA: PQQ-binding-like beta-propeller repeat protein [Actinomycetota bacterium]
MAWSAAVVVVAGATVPLVLAAEVSGRRGAGADLLAHFPLQPGTTSVFDTVTNGRPTGTDVQQITGPALLLSQATPNTVKVVDRFENFFGSGSPGSTTSYLGLAGRRVLRYGTRFTSFDESDPPEILVELPLESGRHWTWSGSQGTSKGSSTTTVLEVGSRDVLGRSIEGCAHLRVEQHATDDQGVASTDRNELWECPRVGLVEEHEVFSKNGQDMGFDLTLREFHAPGLNLGTGAATPPAAGEPRAAPGQTSAVDAGHSGFLPGARLSMDHLSWSVARRSDILYPPVASGPHMVLAENDGTVSSTNVRTGEIDWQIGLQGPIVASPVIAGALVLVADSAKALWALDLPTGAARWAVELPDIVSATPLVAGAVAVVPCDDLSVRGLDLSTGTELWSVSTADLALEPPVLAGGLAVVGDRLGNVTALSPGDGSIAWSDSSITAFSAGDVLLGGLAAGGDTVVATSDASAVFAYDAATGHMLWRSTEPSAVDLAPAVAGDRAIIVASSVVTARDLRTGRRLWRTRIGPVVFAPPLVLGDTVAVLKGENQLVLLSLADGSARTEPIGAPDRVTDQDTQVAMSWVDGSLVIPTDNLGPWPFAILQAFPAPTPDATPPASNTNGVRMAGLVFGMRAPPAGPPALSGDRLYLAGTVFRGDQALGTLFEARPATSFRIAEGRAKTLYQSPESTEFAIAAGDVVLTRAGSRLVAVPRSGGPPAWTAEVGQPFPGSFPVVVGDTVVVPEAGVGLAGIDIRTGDPAWPTVRAPAAASVGTPLVLPDGDVLWGGGALLRVDPRSGRVVRRIRGISVIGNMALDGEAVVAVLQLGSDTVLASFDPAAFRFHWRVPFSPARVFGVVGVGVAAGGGAVVAIDQSNVVHGFDASDGHELWSMQLRTEPDSDPVVLDGRVLVDEGGTFEDLIQREHRITVLDARTGALEGLWEVVNTNFAPFTFVASQGHVLASTGSPVLAIRPEER